MKAEPTTPPSGSGDPTSRPRRLTPRAAVPTSRARLVIWLAAAGAAALIAVPLGDYALHLYGDTREAASVRTLFAQRRYAEAREPLERWLRDRPQSGEARYYRAWLALVDQDPRQAVESVKQAQELGYEAAPLEVLVGIYQARAGRVNIAEPILRAAFDRDSEPRAEVARELAKIYLATYRLPYAAEAIERYRQLVPSDPQPYLWSNEINSRSGGSAALMVRNYRAALERDPNLDKARLGLAEQLSKDRRFDEAEQEYREYLRRNPRDVSARVGLGRNAFQNGDIDGATREFEAALAIDPDQREALKELAQLDMRFGRFVQARRRLERLSRLDPFDHEISYIYSQALRLAGDPEKARVEGERAVKLRKEHDQIVQLRFKIVKDPNDVASRYQVARWMFEHGHADEGLKWAREILRADPRHVEVHRILADYYATHGDPGLANYHRTMASSGQDAR